MSIFTEKTANDSGTNCIRYNVSNIANIQVPVYKAYTMGAVAVTPLVRRIVESFNTRTLSVVFYSILMMSVQCPGLLQASMPLLSAAFLWENLVFMSIFADSKEATRIAGAVGLSCAVGIIVGPFVGAGFAENQNATWRWAFYINLPFLGLLLCVAAIFLPSFTISSSRLLVLHCAVAILLPLALTMPGSAWPWHSGSTIATWIVLQKLVIDTTQENRIFPVNALAHRIAGLAALGAACSGVAYAVSLYYLPLFYAFARGASPIEAAIHIVPFIGVFIGSVILASIVLPLVGYHAVFFLLADILRLIGGAFMTTITSATPDQTILGYQALLAIGIGLVFSNAYSVANASLDDPRERISAAALFNMVSFSGICLALSVAGCVYHNLGSRLLQEVLSEFGFDSVASPLSQTDQRILGRVAETMTFAISELFYTVVFAGAVCVIAGLAMRWQKMDFKSASDQKKGGQSHAEGLWATGNEAERGSRREDSQA
ncbi:major facilitator superfamily domain-containing protein [Thelonectria olida]|uniref:Major facilitator superfamily domain-containing protein n=1 Tax=Thelonectria olida TaxID=1576542 RepID=A0A9P9AK53_9HYPO|nr:major facilitator superfamily domain-containing protein [Thelonectria olida]